MVEVAEVAAVRSSAAISASAGAVVAECDGPLIWCFKFIFTTIIITTYFIIITNSTTDTDTIGTTESSCSTTSS